ncbi:SAM-dependent methyltransferase [Actinomycetospora sp. NBRC 106378]|uniref:SAM-dependent methyltransferase n=1 Tax=Actinomycetospora sp. NBRC 106378 TaxID=3032208 RepID=UPI0024A2CFC9|nr:SAM-dependent methyltransferase [Actinomycetospora sp. NBRC 106378]GLZ54187.1 putative S-adenosyl-L-methionine-dependent methyltransferase [Actinomycetospora sp. NBRC 106378]
MQLPAGVGWTALMTAYARAQEHALFDDPWARAAVDRAGDAARLPDGRESGMWAALGTYFVTRSLFYDRQVRAAVDDGVDQVVLLAAGFDGRAQRLGLPEAVTVYEVDTAEVLAFKDAAVADAPAPTARRVTVRVDLREDWTPALTAAGLDPRRPTVFLAEGLLMYLDEQQSDRLLDAVTGLAAPGSRFVTEWFERNPAGEPSLVSWPDERDNRTGAAVGALFRSGPPLPPAAWLAAHGWDVAAIDDVGTHAATVGRETPWMFDPAHPDGLRVHLVAGVRAR